MSKDLSGNGLLAARVLGCVVVLAATWAPSARAAEITLNATQTVTVSRAGAKDPGPTAGTYVVREREQDTTEHERHISAFSNFDLSGVAGFNPGAGDQAFFDLDFQGRLNTANDSPLYVAQVTGGSWSTSSLPNYQWATKSPATAGPGTQTREHVVVPNVKTDAFGTYTANVTDIVDAWVNGGEPNYGLGVYIADKWQGAGFDFPTLRIVPTMAFYDLNGPNGNFNTTAFDSRDVDSNATAGRLSQSGGLTGGGANTFVLAHSLFDSSNSGSPGMNVAGVNQGSATEYFSFTTARELGTASVTYEDLSFFGDTYSSGGAQVSVRMVDGAGGEQVLAASIALPGGNAPVELRTVDFPDFTSSNVVEWRLYPFGTSDPTHGVRFDDITLHGQANFQTGEIPEPASAVLFALGAAGVSLWRRRTRRAASEA